MIANQKIIQMASHLCDGLDRTSRNKNAKLKTQWERVRVDQKMLKREFRSWKMNLKKLHRMQHRKPKHNKCERDKRYRDRIRNYNMSNKERNNGTEKIFKGRWP